MTAYRITLGYDPDAENPGEEDGSLFRPASFSTRHSNFVHPDDIDPAEVLYPLSYYEHGLCQWGLGTSAVMGGYRSFDSVANAGVLLRGRYLEDDPGQWDRMTETERTDAAKSFLEEYTDWCNGSVYWFDIVQTDVVIEALCVGARIGEQELDSCGGIIGDTHLAYCLSETVDLEADQIEWCGEAAYLGEYLRIPKGDQ